MAERRPIRPNRGVALGVALLVWGLWAVAGLAAGPAADGAPRIALVVGNGAYRSVLQLDNPVSDAHLMARTLEGEGFRVTLLVDADQAALTRGIAQFGRSLRNAGSEATGLFYYAGHGVQSFGTNYLLPVDASLTDAADLSLVAVPAESVLRQMGSARNRTNIVILDACRNNPFESIPDLNDNGLAEMKAPTGTFLAYSTGPGSVALDGADGHSPFTEALAAEMQVPGMPIEQVFKEVRVKVLKMSQGGQTPWDTSSLTSPFAFVPVKARSAEEVAQTQLWDSVKATRDPVQIMLFMRGYPDSPYIDDARRLLNDVMMAELSAKPAAKAPEPAPAVDPREQELIGIAQTTGKRVDYEAYLAAFPHGAYAELAATELAAIAAKTPATDAAATAVPAAPPTPAPAAPPLAGVNVTYTAKLTAGGPPVEGHSLADLIKGSPLFPPIDGIPEEMWKGQHCSNCHAWTREALCTQAKTYLSSAGKRSLAIRHPYGGAFKQTIRTWAEQGCK